MTGSPEGLKYTKFFGGEGSGSRHPFVSVVEFAASRHLFSQDLREPHIFVLRVACVEAWPRDTVVRQGRPLPVGELMRRSPKPARYDSGAGFALYLPLLSRAPLLYVLFESVFRTEDGGTVTIAGYVDFLYRAATTLRIYWRTLRIGLIVTALATASGLPGLLPALAHARWGDEPFWSLWSSCPS